MVAVTVEDVERAYDVRGAEWVTRVTDDAIARACGTPALERGQGYVDAERVRSVTTGDQGRMLLGVVAGGRPTPYSTMIASDGDLDGEPRWSGRCSCPVTTSCKHVAAVLLAVREELVEQADPGARWRSELQSVLSRAERAAAVGHPEPEQLGLLFLLQHRPGPAGRPPVVDVEVRPSRRTRTGRWHQTYGWGEVLRPDFANLGARVRADGPQQELLLALARAAALGEWTSGAQPLTLHDAPPIVWPMLREVLAGGVLLEPEQRSRLVGRTAVTTKTVRLLHEPARLDVEVADDPSGALDVTAVVDGFPAGAEVHLLGDPAHGVIGLHDGELLLGPLAPDPDPLALALLRMPPVQVPSRDADTFTHHFLPAFERHAPVRRRSSDGSTTRVERAGAQPLRLQLHVGDLRPGHVVVQQFFGYGPTRVPTSLGEASPVRRRHDEQTLVQRLHEHLHPLGLYELVGGLGHWPAAVVTLTGIDAVRLTASLDRLALLDDVEIEVADDLPAYEESTAEPLIEIGTSESEGGDADWFDLHVDVTVDGEEVPFEALFAALARDEEFMLLDSGTYFRLDRPALQRLRTLIGEARELADRESGTSINRFQVGLWQELVDLGVVGEQAQAWEQSVERLRQLDKLVPPDPPQGLRAELRPYQLDGYAWLTTLWDAGLGGVLADDMGLGKTLQTLATVARARELGEVGGDAGPVLVVAPTSVIGAWVDEAARFTPDLRVVAVTQTHRKRREPLEEVVAGVDVVVTSYAVLRLDDEQFHALPWRGLVLDEAQAVKNHHSKTYQAVRQVRAPFRLAISGTPLENSLMDLWSLLSITAPGLYPRPDDFTVSYRRPIESGRAPELLEQLRRRIRPLMMRRTKAEVAADLPEKQVQVTHVPLAPAHARIYDQHLQRERQRVLGLLDDPDANRVAILASLTRLRQLALDPALIDDSYSDVGTSAKVAALVEHLREVAAEGHRALVFSQFTRYLRIAEQALHRAGLETCYLDGAMSATERSEQVRAFQEGDTAAFLISLKAGGTGLSLTEADYVFVLDPWWNPATEAQAIDRTHRIGQTRQVMVYRLVSEGTVEDKVVALQQRKRDLFDRVLGSGGALSSAITADDIRGLLDL